MPVLLIATLAARTGSAEAHNYSGATGSTANCAAGLPGGVNMQDPNPHTFYYSALTPSVQAHMDWARGNILDPTTINTTYPGTVSSLTDVVVYDEDYATYCNITWHPQPAGIKQYVGYVFCISLASGNTCEKHEVRYDLSWWPNVGDDKHRSAACHELGHTVGLTHPSNEDGDSCMVDSVTPGLEQWTEHDIAHVNGGWQTLYPDWKLNRDQQIVSKNGRYLARMQSDGNFVLYDTSTSPWAAPWSSATFSSYNTWVHMQTDGNFVVYASDGFGVWALCSTHTFRSSTIMRLQDDGNLVLYAPGPVAVWASKSGNRCY
jgi:hypothetical protein